MSHKMNEATKEATQKYLYPPTNEQIFSFVDEVGVPVSCFERYYGIAQDTLKSVKARFRPLPRKYWAIFYEREIPAYGSYNNFEKPTAAPLFEDLPVNKSTPKPKKKVKVLLHDRLSTIK